MPGWHDIRHFLLGWKEVRPSLTPGLEYTLPVNRCQFALGQSHCHYQLHETADYSLRQDEFDWSFAAGNNRLWQQFTLPANRQQFSFEDGRQCQAVLVDNRFGFGFCGTKLRQQYTLLSVPFHYTLPSVHFQFLIPEED